MLTYAECMQAMQTCELTRKTILLRDVPLGMSFGEGGQRIGFVKLGGFSSSAAAELAYVLSQVLI
jgi:hypothetical protein